MGRMITSTYEPLYRAREATACRAIAGPIGGHISRRNNAGCNTGPAVSGRSVAAAPGASSPHVLAGAYNSARAYGRPVLIQPPGPVVGSNFRRLWAFCWSSGDF